MKGRDKKKIERSEAKRNELFGSWTCELSKCRIGGWHIFQKLLPGDSKKTGSSSYSVRTYSIHTVRVCMCACVRHMTACG